MMSLSHIVGHVYISPLSLYLSVRLPSAVIVHNENRLNSIEPTIAQFIFPKPEDKSPEDGGGLALPFRLQRKIELTKQVVLDLK